MAQKAQSCNWVLKVNLNLYIFLYNVFACSDTELLEFICSSVFSNQKQQVSTCFIYAVVWLSLHTWHKKHNIFKYKKNENLKP